MKEEERLYHLSNILFFSMPFWGHINPNIELLKTLRTKHNILAASSKKFEKVFQELGIPMIEYPKLVSDFFGTGVLNSNENYVKEYYASQYDYNVLSKINSLNNSVVEEVYCSLIEKIEEFSPDIIICDSQAFWGPVFSIKCRKKYICIESATNMSDSSQDKYFLEYIDRVISKEVGSNLDSLEILNVFNKLERKQKKFYAKFSGCRLKDYYLPEKNYMYMTKDFQVGSEEFTEDISFLGFNMSVEKIDKQDKIFVTRGTITDFYNLDILKRILSYLDVSSNFKITATKGNVASLKDEISNFENNENIFIKDSVNQIKELSESRLMISHGGITGVREAIMCETPMIIVPATFHCYQVGLAIEKNNVGILLKKYPLDKKELNEAVNKIIHCDEYYNNVAKLKTKMIIEHSIGDICDYIDELG